MQLTKQVSLWNENSLEAVAAPRITDTTAEMLLGSDRIPGEDAEARLH